MNSLLFTTGTEELLLGLCVGRYALLRQRGWQINFHDVIMNELRLFSAIPRLTVRTPHSTSGTDINPNQVIIGMDYLETFLASPEVPNQLIVIPNGALSDGYCTFGEEADFPVSVIDICDPSEKTFLENLLLNLHDIIALPVDICFACETINPRTSGESVAWSHYVHQFKDSLAATGRLAEDKSEILISRITTSDRSHSQRTCFRIGQLFGEVFAELEYFFCPLPDASRSDIDIGGKIDALLDYPLISTVREISVRYLLCEAPEGRVPRKRYRTLISRTILSQNDTCKSLLDQRWIRTWSLDGISGPFELSDYENELKRQFWITFAHLRSIIEGSELDLTLLGDDQNNRNVIAKDFETLSHEDLLPSDPLERAICSAQQIFDGRATNGHQPIDVVRLISSCAEQITKQLWSDKFKVEYEGRLSAVLTEKMRSASKIQNRFVSLAMLIHKQYRIPSTHMAEKCKFTWSDANLVISAIGALKELAHEIKDKG